MPRDVTNRQTTRLSAMLLIALMGTLAMNATAAIALPEAKVQRVSLDGVGTVPFSFDEFDTRRGTLDSVDVSVNLVVTSTSATLPNLTPLPFGGAVPSPYNAQIQVGLGFSGWHDRGFSSITDSLTFSPLVADGAGSPANSVSVFHFGFTVDGKQDLTGIAKADHYDVATPMLVETTLDDFLPNNPLATGIPVFGTLDTSLLALDLRVVPLTAAISGSMTVTYNYTRELDVTRPVPIPAAVWLFGSALLVAGAFGGRKPAA